MPSPFSAQHVNGEGRGRQRRRGSSRSDLPSDLAGLERRRAGLYDLISQVGDFRRGALNAVRRKCGKSNCVCAQPGHLGHGPQYNLTRHVAGKTVNTRFRPGPELQKVEREVAGHQRFLDLAEVTEVNEAICALRPVLPEAQTAPPPPEGEKMTCSGPVRSPGVLAAGGPGEQGGDLPSTGASRCGVSDQLASELEEVT